MKLLEDGALKEDEWLFLDDDQPLPAHESIVISLARWQAEQDALRAHQGKVALCLDCGQGESVRGIAQDVQHFAMMVLAVAAFKDGRAFSAARLLRERYHYQKPIRLRGPCLPDQWLFYHRCGVNVFEWDDKWRKEDWQEALAEFSHAYQPAADAASPIMSLRQRRLQQKNRARTEQLSASLKKNIARRKEWTQNTRSAS